MSSLSHFDETSGVIPCITDWGRWWQTIDEVHVEISLKSVAPKDINIIFSCNSIKCVVENVTVLEGKLFSEIHDNEAIWTVEDNRTLLNIVLLKAKRNTVWEALMKDKRYSPDLWTMEEMRKKIDLENFQIEHPGMDFSNAKLQTQRR